MERVRGSACIKNRRKEFSFFFLFLSLIFFSSFFSARWIKGCMYSSYDRVFNPVPSHEITRGEELVTNMSREILFLIKKI